MASDRALAMVGQQVRLDGVPVTCIGVRDSHSVVTTEEGDFAGVQFHVRYSDGCERWSETFADESLPVGDIDGPTDG